MENMTMEERLAALEARVAELEQLVAQNKQNIAENKKHITANKGLLSKLTNEETSKMSEYMQAFLEPAKAGAEVEPAAKTEGPSLLERMTEMATERNTVTTDAWLEQVGKKSNE